MDLSKDATKMLRWMKRHDQWQYIEGLQSGYRHYEYRTFAALKDAGFVDATVFDYDIENPEYDEDGSEYFRESYQISDAGKAYLERIPSKLLPELRAWITLGISLAALIISIVSIILKQSQ